MADVAKKDNRRCLLVFDFDHTLIDENSDESVTRLAPGGQLPEEIKSLYNDDSWTNYMAEIFKYLHRCGCQPDQILNLMSQIPLTPGMRELLDYTSAAGYFDHIIISDANSVFIDHILKVKGLSSLINQTFTNPAEFDSEGCLQLQRYHTQDWCKLSTVNLCKGHILKNYITAQQAAGVEYKNVVYVGDGYNDLCPSLTLRPEDSAMPRIGFKLHKIIEEMTLKNKPVDRSELKASVIPWQTGLDILKHIQSI